MKNITIMGNVGKQPETRTTQGGDKVTSFSVAVQDGFGDKKTTLWFDVSFWGKRGETIAQYVSKGDSICIGGDLSTREYEGKTYLQVRGNDFTFGKKSQSQDSGQQGGYDAPPQGGAYADSEEIPFICEWR